MAKILECAKCHRTFQGYEHLNTDGLSQCQHEEINEYEVCDFCGYELDEHIVEYTSHGKHLHCPDAIPVYLQ